MYMPAAAMIQAMMAPNGPVAMAKVRGSEKMPAPTMEPTTMPVRANSESFCTEFDAMKFPLRVTSKSIWATSQFLFAGAPFELRQTISKHSALAGMVFRASSNTIKRHLGADLTAASCWRSVARFDRKSILKAMQK